MEDSLAIPSCRVSDETDVLAAAAVDTEHSSRWILEDERSLYPAIVQLLFFLDY